MAILKNKLIKDYTMIPNWTIYSKEISNNAFRVLVYLYSKPENWEVRQANIAKELGVGRTALSSWIKELKSINAIEVLKVGMSYEYHLKVDLCDVRNSDVRESDNRCTDYRESEQYNKTDTNKTNSNNIIIYFSNPEVNNVFLEFLAMRKEMKKKATPTAIKKMVKKLSVYDDDIKIKAINRSIESNYQGIFPESINTTKPFFDKKVIDSSVAKYATEDPEPIDPRKLELLKKMMSDTGLTEEEQQELEEIQKNESEDF